MTGRFAARIPARPVLDRKTTPAGCRCYNEPRTPNPEPRTPNPEHRTPNTEHRTPITEPRSPNTSHNPRMRFRISLRRDSVRRSGRLAGDGLDRLAFKRGRPMRKYG